MRYVLSEKRFKMDRERFIETIAMCSKETRARYLRDYDRYHRNNPTKAPTRPQDVHRPVSETKVRTSQARPPTGPVKRVVKRPVKVSGAKSVSNRYVLSERRFETSYNKFKEEIQGLSPATQARYWRDWNRYHLNKSRSLRPSDKGRFTHVLRVYCEDSAGRPVYFLDLDGSPRPYYYKAIRDDHRVLDSEALDLVRISVNESTNVHVVRVEVVQTSDSYLNVVYH